MSEYHLLINALQSAAIILESDGAEAEAEAVRWAKSYLSANEDHVREILGDETP